MLESSFLFLNRCKLRKSETQHILMDIDFIIIAKFYVSSNFVEGHHDNTKKKCNVHVQCMLFCRAVVYTLKHKHYTYLIVYQQMKSFYRLINRYIVHNFLFKIL